MEHPRPPKKKTPKNIQNKMNLLTSMTLDVANMIFGQLYMYQNSLSEKKGVFDFYND